MFLIQIPNYVAVIGLTRSSKQVLPVRRLNFEPFQQLWIGQHYLEISKNTEANKWEEKKHEMRRLTG